MDLSVKSDVIVWARRETHGGKLRSHHHLLVAQSIRRHMRPEMLTAFFRDGAEKGFQNRAALTFAEQIEDHIKDNDTIIIMFDRYSELWKGPNWRSFWRRWQSKYVDVEEGGKKVRWLHTKH